MAEGQLKQSRDSRKSKQVIAKQTLEPNGSNQEIVERMSLRKTTKSSLSLEAIKR